MKQITIRSIPEDVKKTVQKEAERRGVSLNKEGGRGAVEKIKVMLDTSAYSAYLRGNEEVKQAIREADEIYMNPVVLGELYAGFARGAKEKKNISILREFLASPRVQIAVIDEETAER